MISYSRQTSEQQPDGPPPSTEDHIAPAPRVSVQAFCETVETAAAGVPPRAVTVRQYHPENPRHMAAIRLTYPKISAVAGPCGLWPEDLGPSVNNKGYFDNKPYYNFGCSYQRNMAAMVDNPSDLVQPRPETPAFAPRRGIAFDKYRKGTSTATTYSESDKAKLSDTGK